MTELSSSKSYISKEAFQSTTTLLSTIISSEQKERLRVSTVNQARSYLNLRNYVLVLFQIGPMKNILIQDFVHKDNRYKNGTASLNGFNPLDGEHIWRGQMVRTNDWSVTP